MRLTIYLAIVLALAFGIIFAAIEENPHVQDNGGGAASGGAYGNQASIGQPVICFSNGGSYQNCAGFIGSLMGTELDIYEQPGKEKLPNDFRVSAPTPNPFNSICRFEVEVNQTGLLIVRFYDISGRMVYGENKEILAGHHVLDFNAGELPSGTYLYSISMGNNNFNGKVLLVK